jgi:hypothetical protein
VWNRTHISSVTGVTPYEALCGKRPSLRHIGVFGCDVYRHVPKHERTATMASHVEPGIYLGHNDAQNAAFVWLLASKKIVTTRDVTYRSDSFAFMRLLDSGADGAREAQRLCSEAMSGEVEDLRADAEEGSADADANSSDQEYVVERIVGQRKRNGRVEFKVHWAGFDASEDSWEPEDSVSDLAAMDVWLEQQAAAAAPPAVAPPAPEAAAVVQPDAAAVVPAAAAAPPARVVAPAAPGPRQSPRLFASSAALRAAAAPAAVAAAPASHQ